MGIEALARTSQATGFSAFVIWHFFVLRAFLSRNFIVRQYCEIFYKTCLVYYNGDISRICIVILLLIVMAMKYLYNVYPHCICMVVKLICLFSLFCCFLFLGWFLGGFIVLVIYRRIICCLCAENRNLSEYLLVSIVLKWISLKK